MNDRSPPGYIYAELDIFDQAMFYDEYMPKVRPVLTKYGATFVVAGGDPQVLEGGRTVKRIVLVKFDSVRKAREFYDSAEYQQVAAYRFKSAKAHLYVFEGTGDA